MILTVNGKTYHSAGGRYWYTLLNGRGNEVVVECTRDEYNALAAIVRGDDARHTRKLGSHRGGGQ